MYQVTIKGRNLAELKKAVSDINSELHNGTSVVKGMEKDLESANVEEFVKKVEPVIADVTPENSTTAESDADSEGISWDERIHSSSKTKTTKGLWKLKRGVDKDLVTQIKAEQKGEAFTKATQVETAAPAPVVNEPAPVVNEPAPVVETPVETVTPAAPALPSMNNGHTIESFIQNFPMVIGSLITEGKVTQDYINQLKDYFGVTEIWMINDEQKAEVFNGFVQANIIAKVG